MFPTLSRAIRLTGKAPPPHQAVDLVMSVLRQSPSGASTKEIYQRATSTAIPRNDNEPGPEHPLKSMRYLKKTLLATLQEKQVIEKFHVMKDPVQYEEEAASTGKGKKKKAPSKLTWLWRIQERERSVAQPNETHDARMERKSTATEANKGPRMPAQATA